MNTNKLYAYKTTFIINSDSSLEDFWSYLIFRLNLEQSEYTYDRFARLYNLLCEYKTDISSMHGVYISLQESSDKYFMWINTSNQSFLNDFMKRLSRFNFEYVYKNGILNYSINKKVHIKNPLKVDDKIYEYSFIDQDDIDEMTDTIEKMQEKNYEKLGIQLSMSEISEYRTTFSYYSSYLKHYPKLNTINNIVAELSVLLSLYPEECLKAENDFRVLIKSFLNNLAYWQDRLFIQGNEKIDFMDNSLKADLSQMKIILDLYDEIDEENDICTLDEIFDF